VGLIDLAEYAWLIPILLFVALLFSKRDTWILPAVVPMITANEVSQRIAEVVRNIVNQIFEILTPVIDVLGVAQIIIGLLLAMGLRQEFLGWRLIAAGIIMLIFVHVIAPFLLRFI
jgi:4-amino-4-deoxy-L-arabinose transferase-like glycosyltransferase